MFSSSYKPKDFAGKTPEQIFTEVKLDKFSKSIKNVNDPEYVALSNEVKNAIDLLIDLKNGKLEIYKKCYSGKSEPIAHMPAMRPHSIIERPHSPPRPMHTKPVEPMRAKPVEPVVAKPEPAVEEEEVMTGGRGRKHKKTHRRKHGKRKGKKRSKTARRKY